MKRLLFALTLVGLLAVPAQGQIYDGLESGVGYVSSGPPVNTPFFRWTVDALGGQEWDFLCVDEGQYIQEGGVYTGVFFQLSSLPMPLASALGYSITGLQQAAALYSYIGEQGLQGSRLAQDAVWHVMGTDAGDGFDSGASLGEVQDLISSALVAWDGSYDDYYLMLRKGDLVQLADGSWSVARYVSQPQLTRFPVPEPGTMFLLGSALLGVGFAGVRRRDPGI